VAEAVRLLGDGRVVALPTETVYGLAADALNADAALKIFEAKERPRFDPLIVHLPNDEWLARVANVPEASRELVARLAQRFWPGPLTLVLPRRAIVPDVVTSGLSTVAVRISAHPVFSEIVSTFGKPLAAPSANRFGNISPTAAEHVHAELHGRIELIVDGGPTTHGVESTIVSLGQDGLSILRPGPISAEELREFGEVAAASSSTQVQAPGQLPSHYAPRTPLVLTRDLRSFEPDPGVRTGALSWGDDELTGFASKQTFSPSRDLREAAANLFRHLRELDAAGLDLIVAEEVPEVGLGVAIMDRLRRAATR
jgi:L-threonylcarbamoyladenylate synthase